MAIIVDGVRLLDFRLEGKWTKKDLWKRLMDEHGAMENPFNEKGYSRYFLKILGYYDKALVPEAYACLACPHYYRNHGKDDYNLLRDDKISVLVLYANDSRFRDYGVLGCYYTDRPEVTKYSNVELWGEEYSLWKWLGRKIGLRA